MTASRLGLETIEILERVGYTTPSGEHVDLRPWSRQRPSYPPDVALPRVGSSQRSTTFSTENVSTLVVLDRAPSRRPEIRRSMAERIDRVLAVAAAHEQDALVLGAWGCGVFGNDPAEIASLFKTAFTGPFAGVFERVIFAILDSRPDEPVIGPFASRFGL